MNFHIDYADEVAITNQFGFVEKTMEMSSSFKAGLNESSESIESLNRQSTKIQKQVSATDTAKTLKQQNARIFKWKEMLETDPDKEKMEKLYKRRSRKGIPDSLRGYAWKIMIKGRQFLEKDPIEYYKELLELPGDPNTLKSIFKDVTRTFNSHVYFKDKFGKGQKALFLVLKALAIYDLEVGYTQGMGYVVALFLTYMDQEDTFACIVGLMKGWGLRDVFISGMPGL